MDRRRQQDDDDYKPPLQPSRNATANNTGSSLKIGDHVTVNNLVKSAELNGRSGIIVNYNPSNGRFSVDLNNQPSDKSGFKSVSDPNNIIAVKAANLHLSRKFKTTSENAGSDNFAETFPDTTRANQFAGTSEKSNAKAMMASSGGRATVPGAVRSYDDDDFAEVFPDTSGRNPIISEKANVKTTMAHSRNNATSPGAVAVNDHPLDNNRPSAKSGDDEGLKPLGAPPQRLGPAEHSTEYAPEVFNDTTNRSAASFSQQQTNFKDKKKIKENTDEWNNNSTALPGATRVDGPNFHNDLENDNLRESAAAGTIAAASRGVISTDNQDLAIAAEVVPEAEDVEAQIQQRLERETENIETQVHQRILNEAVQADVYEDDTDEKLARVKKLIVIAICFVIIVAVVLVIVFVVVLKDDNSITANPTLSPTLSLLPSSSPTAIPTMTPTSSPTPVPPCTLCSDGTIPDDLTEKTVFDDGQTCSAYMEDLEKLTILDSNCLQGQALAWLFCGCPLPPPRPENAICSQCRDGSSPIEKANTTSEGLGNCTDYHAAVGVLGDSPLFQCAEIVDIFRDDCQCPQDEAERLEYFLTILQPISGDIILDESSAQNRALTWLVSEDPAYLDTDTTELEVQQRYVAAIFYFSTGGASWELQNSFLSEDDVCEWNALFSDAGISCNTDGLIDKISLESNNLEGIIPFRELAALPALEIIELNENLLSGRAPEDIVGFSSLEKVDVSSNFLTGPIPEYIFLSSSLKEVVLSDNLWDSGTFSIPETVESASVLEIFECDTCNIASSIPASISRLSMLRSLNLNRNGLTSSIPTNIGELTKLEELRLYNNSLTSSIPPELASLPSLVLLNLGINSLSGKIPPFYSSTFEEIWLVGSNLSGNLDDFFQNSSTSLRTIRLDANFLTGTISADLGKFTSLSSLNLGQNTLVEGGRNTISGAIPTEIGLLTDLESLYLYDLNITSSIPSELASLLSLETVSISSNFLSGNIPPFDSTNLLNLYLVDNSLTGSLDNFFKSSSTSIEFLRLDSNFLTGTIASEIGKFTNLVNVNIGHNLNIENKGNFIVGSIPTSIGLLTALDELRLNHLSLNGSTIPTEFGLLTSLSLFGSYNTSIGGPIPSELGNLAQLEVLDLGYNELTSNIPQELANCESLQTLSVALNQLEGVFPESVASLPELELLYISGNNFRLFNYDKLFCSRDDLIDNLSVTCTSGPCSCCASCCIENTCYNSTFTVPPALTPTFAPTVTMMPTISCNDADGTSLLRVYLTTDVYSNETSWNVQDMLSNETLLEGGPYATGVNGFVDETCISIEESCLMFNIYDSYGDGIIDLGNGEGYALYFNDQKIASGGEFTAPSESTLFGGMCPSTNQPSLSPSSDSTSTSTGVSEEDCLADDGKAFFRLTLNLDENPEETNFNLLSDSFEFIYIEGPFEAGNDNYKTIIRETCLDIDACYTFTIGDASSNGLSGDSGYELYFNGEVVKTGGDFGFIEQTFLGSCA